MLVDSSFPQPQFVIRAILSAPSLRMPLASLKLASLFVIPVAVADAFKFGALSLMEATFALRTQESLSNISGLVGVGARHERTVSAPSRLD